MPPEVNTARLMAGAGIEPMLQAAAGWEAFAISLETQADELAASLTSLASLWSGMGAERAVTATMPMVIWLRMLSLQALKRAMQAVQQANAYALAMGTTPQLVEIELNHITHAVLEATNFLGINTLPIGLNELDYARMWELAATVMNGYQAETALNATFEPITPAKPVVMPGVGELAMATGLASAAALAPATAARDLVFAQVSGQGKASEFALKGGRAAHFGNEAANSARSEASQAKGLGNQQDQMLSQGMQQGVQMATQLGSSLAQLPQQLMQGVTQPFQQLSQPLQQVSSMFGQMGMSGAERPAQVGLMGASPFSNHPAIGGTGAASGAGLVRAASLPGAGGTALRTPLMANLIGAPSMSPVSVAAGASAGGAGAGLAPVGAGAGGTGPTGMSGQRAKSGGSKSALTAPSPLPYDLSEDEEDDW
jgi:PPE-repeat protein